jgi:hypothetical protein
MPNVMDLLQCRPAPNLFCNPAAKPWPRYGLLLYGDSTGNLSYQALTAKYEHRTDRGLNLRLGVCVLQGAYRHLAVRSDHLQSDVAVPALFQRSGHLRRPASRRRQPGLGGTLCRWSRYGREMPPWTDVVIGRWTVTGIAVIAAGQPISLRGPNQTGSTLINHLPNRVCDGRSDQLSGSVRSNGFVWFDTACFPVPQVGYFGNSGPTVVNGPGLNNWDLGVEKSFPLSREARLQFRAEMFNAWNHAQFQQPNGDSGAGVNFGRIPATRPPRLIQLALKVLW